jgi:hypothetical protein
MRSIEGWSRILTLNNITPIAVDSIRNYIVVVGRSGSGWGIWTIDTD